MQKAIDLVTWLIVNYVSFISICFSVRKGRKIAWSRRASFAVGSGNLAMKLFYYCTGSTINFIKIARLTHNVTRGIAANAYL